MSNVVWKEYEANPLTHSAAHYLMAIRLLLERQGYARVTDIARELNITRGSCSISLKPLKRRGLVTEDDNKFLQLSEEGRRLADTVVRNDHVLSFFLRDVLGVPTGQAEIDACKIEHLLSRESGKRLTEFLRFMASDCPEVGRFLSAYKRFDPTCQGDVGRCELCQEACIAEAGARKSPGG